MAIGNIFIESTDKAPMIDFNQSTGNLILAGRSIPENAAKVYEPLLNWTLEYINNARPTTNFRINLEYFNTATSIWLSKIIKVLCSIKGEDQILFIHIYFNIEDFDSIDDVKEDIIQLTNVFITNDKLSVGYKVYGIDDEGKIIKEALLFI
jgi:hypothetical protein